MKVLIRWNKTHVWSIGTGFGDGSVIQFIPGVNEKTQEDWDKVKNHPEVLKRQELEVVDPIKGKVKMLEIIKSKEVVKAQDSDSSGSDSNGDSDSNSDSSAGLSGLSAKEAKELVKETFHTPTLRAWLEDETRSGVKSSIEKQLEAIEKDRLENESDNDDSQE